MTFIRTLEVGRFQYLLRRSWDQQSHFIHVYDGLVFLNPKGTTRLNVSWTFNAKSLQPDRQQIRSLQRKGAEQSEDFLLTAYLVTRKANYAPANLRLRQYYLPDGVDSVLPVQTWVTKGIQGSINLALQWNHAWTQHDASGKPQPSAILGIGVQTLDSIPALNGLGQILEMSDILLTELNDEGLPDEKMPVAATHWAPEDPLGFILKPTSFASTRMTAQAILSATKFEIWITRKK